MTKYLVIFATMFALVACGVDDTKIQYTEDGWAIYAGLEWAAPSGYVTWYEAAEFCEAMGARVPTINELRKIIINCPDSTYGGICEASDPDCLGTYCGGDEDCYCLDNGELYSALGDRDENLWSSSSNTDNNSLAWLVDFNRGYVVDFIKTGYTNGNFQVRCVR